MRATAEHLRHRRTAGPGLNGDGSLLRLETLMRRLLPCLRAAQGRAASLDEDTSFPREDVEALARLGAAAAVLPTPVGGLGLGTEAEGALPLATILRKIGYASLPLGRLYEGHVNALALIARYGSPAHLAEVAADAKRGLVFGVWNTEGSPPVRMKLQGGTCLLEGSKTFASGAGHLARALVTARDDDNRLWMLLLRLDEMPATRADLRDWRAQGMRASASGRFDFSGVEVSVDRVIGGDEDYHRQPLFSGGAWRFAAVQLGGLERILDETTYHLRRTQREDDPYQIMRVGQAAIAAEGARLWVEEAARRTEAATWEREDGCSAVAYVNLARSAVERAGLDVLELAQRSVGLAAFSRRHPIEKLARDLATYLRQPAPDRALIEGGRYVLASEKPVAELWR